MIVAIVLKRQFFTLIFAVLLSLFFQVVVEFNWHHSVASPRKPSSRHTDLWDNSYTSRVIADFVTDFVAMPTRVGRGGICLTSFNSPTPKTQC